jgi:hypothetical protein
VEGLKESEEMSDEVEIAVRERGVVIETAGCRRRALTPRLQRSNSPTQGRRDSWGVAKLSTVGDREI